MVAALPYSLYWQSYPEPGQEGRNNLIEKISCCECANSKNEKNKGSLTLRVSCGVRGGCWLAGDGGGTALFPL